MENTKKFNLQLVVVSIISFFLAIAVLVAVVNVRGNAEKVIADTIGYQKIGSTFLMADDYNNKACKVTYTFNGEEREGTVKTSDREVKPQYVVLIDKEGNMIDWENITVGYFISGMAFLSGIICIVVLIDDHRKERAKA